MTEQPLLTVPARHLQPGDTTHGFAVSSRHNVVGIDGTTIHHVDFKLVVPYTSHYMMVTVREQDLDYIKFPLTKRGDTHDTRPRNEALGLPADLHQAVYTATVAEPVATYPAGTLIKDVKHFDRGQHILFACPEHPTSAWSSKDPRSSSIFPQSDNSLDCTITRRCHVSIYDYVLTADYKPTRNG